MTNRPTQLVAVLLVALTFGTERTSLAQLPQSDFGRPQVVVPAPRDPRYARDDSFLYGYDLEPPGRCRMLGQPRSEA